MSKIKAQHDSKSNEREVTDPVTHLPLTIHDNTSVELAQIPPSEPSDTHEPQNQTSVSNERHAGMENLVREETTKGWWNDGEEDQGRRRIECAIVAAVAAGTGGMGTLGMSCIIGASKIGWSNLLVANIGSGLLAILAAIATYILVRPRRTALKHQDEKLDHTKITDKGQSEARPESAAWFNSFATSLWPIVNPALFTAVADMLEDAMQATLPKLIHGVKVADIGQGSEPMRILGIRWLDAGDAAKDKDGMKAEEGDFVNLEVAVSYRSVSTKSGSNGLKGRSRNAHLLMQFWLAGGFMFPVWVEMTGLLATARIRVQLTPNPPFTSLLTLTLLGQPKVTVSATPLAREFLNVMNIPGLSGWLQRSIDAAVGEYVAPRSLNLDLKTLLMGREKMDTEAVGILVIRVRSAKGFKQGDGTNVFEGPEAKYGDPYVTLGWGKWGKPLWATRIIQKEEEPVWEESTALLIGPEELNAQERLRLQLWDSDRNTADDHLGTVEVSLEELMTRPETLNRRCSREDSLTDTNGKSMPGALAWDVAYFAKTTLEQHNSSREKPEDVKAMQERIEKDAEDKLREAKTHDESGELTRQKKQDLKERTEEIIAGSRPNEEWPTGILSVNIEQITGLEVEKIRESGVREGGEDEEADDLPSAYCTIIINHQRVYKTRTKLKSDKPYYNAGTEKFIRDWRNTTVIIAVRDARMHENDSLLGVIVLPLNNIFKERSQINDAFPITGGIGYGRMRLALTFRSVQAKLPREFMGWDLGTLNIHPEVTADVHLPPDLASCRLVVRTLYGKGKFIPQSSGGWKQNNGRPIRLPVKDRYASCLLILFKKHAVGKDNISAFATLWLKDIPDDEDIKLTLPVHNHDDKRTLERARSNARDDLGERVGIVNLTLRFCHGLSGYHLKVADQDRHMAGVIETLDCAEESREIDQDLLYDHAESSSGSDGESGSDSSDYQGKPGESGSGSGSRGMRDEVTDYRKRKGELHRKHRGLMQWSGVRNAVWMVDGVGDTAKKMKDEVKGRLTHQSKSIGLEKEV